MKKKWDFENDDLDMAEILGLFAMWYRAAREDDLATGEYVVMDVINYSSQGFLVTAYQANFGTVCGDLTNSYLQSIPEARGGFKTKKDSLEFRPVYNPVWYDSKSGFVRTYSSVLQKSYTHTAVDSKGWKSLGLKMETALCLTPKGASAPTIALMIKKYSGGGYCAGISMSDGTWFKDSGFLPADDEDGSGICDHISNVHTDLCKVSEGDPAGPDISVTLDGIRVEVKAKSWSTFTIRDA